MNNEFEFEYLDVESNDIISGYTYKWMRSTSDLLGFLTVAMVKDDVLTKAAAQVTKDFVFNELQETCGKKLSNEFKNGELTLDNIFVHSVLIDDIDMKNLDEYKYVILSFIDEDGKKVVLQDMNVKNQKTLDLNSGEFKRIYARESNKRLTRLPAYESKVSFDVGTFTFAEVTVQGQGGGIGHMQYRIRNVAIPKVFSSDLDCVKYVYACNIYNASKEEASEFYMDDVQSVADYQSSNTALYKKYKNDTITFGDIINNTEDGLGYIYDVLSTCDYDNYFTIPLTIVTPNKTCVTFIHDFGDTRQIVSSCGYMMISNKKIDFPLWVQDTSDVTGYALVYAYYCINGESTEGNNSFSRDEVLGKLKQLYPEFDSYANSFEAHTLSLEDKDIKSIFDALGDQIHIFSELTDK